MRDDLRILVTSATLDGARVARHARRDPVIASAGPAYPVETRYAGRDPPAGSRRRLRRACSGRSLDERGSILAFLPGQAEILRVARITRRTDQDPEVDVAPLYGAMEARAQDLAVTLGAAGQAQDRARDLDRRDVARRSRACASSSMRQMRVPRYEPDVGLTRLETVRVARQRRSAARPRGARRAGRLLPAVGGGGHGRPARRSRSRKFCSADLAGLALDLAVWGAADPAG